MKSLAITSLVGVKQELFFESMQFLTFEDVFVFYIVKSEKRSLLKGLLAKKEKYSYSWNIQFKQTSI
jgi:hypothetical protein